MKIIYSKSERVTNRATSVTASSENANYPASNLLLGQVSRVFRSVSGTPPLSTVTLTVAVPAGVNNAIGIFGCNATDMIVAVKNVAENITYFTETFDMTPASPARTWNRVFKQWASNGYALHIIITLTAPTTANYHEVGEIVVGETVTLPNPKYGGNQDRENYQVVQQKAGGGYYIHDGAKPRLFDLNWRMVRETSYDDLDEIYEAVGQNPLAMLLFEGYQNDMKWCGYFHITSKPRATHNVPIYSDVGMTIREAV
jgi:hypothetical protein